MTSSPELLLPEVGVTDSTGMDCMATVCVICGEVKEVSVFGTELMELSDLVANWEGEKCTVLLSYREEVAENTEEAFTDMLVTRAMELVGLTGTGMAESDTDGDGGMAQSVGRTERGTVRFEP